MGGGASHIMLGTRQECNPGGCLGCTVAREGNAKHLGSCLEGSRWARHACTPSPAAVQPSGVQFASACQPLCPHTLLPTLRALTGQREQVKTLKMSKWRAVTVSHPHMPSQPLPYTLCVCLNASACQPWCPHTLLPTLRALTGQKNQAIRSRMGV